MWFALSGISIPFGERLKKFRYRLFTQYMSRLPVPAAAANDRRELEDLARRVSFLSKQHYELVEGVAHRLNQRFNSAQDGPVPEQLKQWPGLGFKALGDEIKGIYRLRQSPWNDPHCADEWDAYVVSKSDRCEELSRSIAAAEDEIHRRVYRLFNLSPKEAKILENETAS